MKVRPISIAVVPGSTVEITIPQIYLNVGKITTLLFVLTEPLKQIFKTRVGTEVVTIVNGVGGSAIALEDNNGDIFYADRLILCYEYRIKYGNNGAAISTGAAGAVEHFINLNTPKCSKPYNPSGLITPAATPVV